jgi:lipid kinase YegS
LNLRIILNGKKAGLKSVREAIYSARKDASVEVRVTWEHGDVHRLVREAVADGCGRLVAAGGDGTVNEVVDAVMKHPVDERPEIAIMPLGTANDFATACGIPTDPSMALSLAQTASPGAVDVGRANEYIFINVASGGVGAQITANTPPALKNFLGGGAYTLSGVVQALSFTPYRGQLRFPDGEFHEDEIIVAAACNGRQAGGGQRLAPAALINDGMLDVVGLRNFPKEALGQVIRELTGSDPGGEYVVRLRVPWVEWESQEMIPINLDGEPIKASKVRFEVIPGAIKLVLPQNCPVT